VLEHHHHGIIHDHLFDRWYEFHELLHARSMGHPKVMAPIMHQRKAIERYLAQPWHVILGYHATPGRWPVVILEGELLK